MAKSVHLTFCLGPEKQRAVDCAAEGFERLTISFEHRDRRDDERHASIGERDRPSDRQSHGVDPIHVPDGSRALEVRDGTALGGNYGRARCGVSGHGFPQAYQVEDAAFQQSYQARASGDTQ